MKIIPTILASLLVLYVWIRLINTVFGKNPIKKQYILRIIISGIVLVWWLFGYRYLLISNPNFAEFDIVKDINFKTIIIFWFYCMALLLFLITIFHRRKNFILQIFLSGALFFVAIGIWGIALWINSLILYYIISAYAEEYLKYTTSNSFLQKNWKNIWFFAILLGIAFGLIENIFYLIAYASWTENLIWFILSRWLISVLVHVVATTTIASIYHFLNKKTLRPLALLVGMIGWVWLHSVYNISLEYQFSILIVALIIFFFFLLSWFLFRSDLLYDKNQRK